MAEDLLTQTPAQIPAEAPAFQPAMRPRGSGRAVLGAAVIAFLIGAGAVGYVAWEGLPPFDRAAPMHLAPPAATAPVAPAAEPAANTAALVAQQDTLEGRMAALEQRLDSLDLRADAAAGNAARAEALLIAFAARRALDRGAPLGYLEDQLRLRFGDGQPNAVATVIAAGREPVTLDQILAGLDSLAPTLTQSPADVSTWTKVKQQIASLFVIRREATPSPAPQAMLAHARVLLAAGKTDDAIGEVRALPGAASATDWFAAARRYDGARRALDVLETSAMLDTRGLKSADGEKVTGRSPITPTTDAALPLD